MILEKTVIPISGQIVDICILGRAVYKGVSSRQRLYARLESAESSHEVPTLNTDFREEISRPIYN